MFELYERMNEIDDEASLGVVKRKSQNIVEGYSVRYGRGKSPVEFDSLEDAVKHINDGMKKKAENSYILYNDGKEMIWLDWYTSSRDGSNSDYTVSRHNDKSVEFDGELKVKGKLNEEDDASKVVTKLSSSDYEPFVQILNSDGKSKAFLDFLRDHYKMGDDALGTIKKANPSEKTLTCNQLKPTQQNISIEKSLGMIKSGGWSEKIINDPVNAFDTPTVTYAGQYIVDGHHRWSKVCALNGPESELKVLDFPAISGVTWEDMLKAVRLAIISTNPSADLINEVGSDNMLSTQGAKLAADFYNANACDAVVAAMKAKNRGETKEEQAKTVEDNVANTSTTSQPVSGAPKRDYMPQMDDGGAAKNQLIKNGVVDMTESNRTDEYDDDVETLKELYDDEVGNGWSRTTPYSTQKGQGVHSNNVPDWWKKSGRSESEWGNSKDWNREMNKPYRP